MELENKNREHQDQLPNALNLNELAICQRAVALYMTEAYKDVVHHSKLFSHVHMLVYEAQKAHLATTDMMKRFESTISFMMETLIPMVDNAIQFQDTKLLAGAFRRVIEQTGVLRDHTNTTKNRYNDVDRMLNEYNEQFKRENTIKEDSEMKAPIELGKEIDTMETNISMENEIDTLEKNPSMENEIDTLEKNPSMENEIDTLETNISMENEIDTLKKNSSMENEIDTLEKNSSMENEIDTLEKNPSMENEIDTLGKKPNMENQAEKTLDSKTGDIKKSEGWWPASTASVLYSLPNKIFAGCRQIKNPFKSTNIDANGVSEVDRQTKQSSQNVKPDENRMADLNHIFDGKREELSNTPARLDNMRQMKGAETVQLVEASDKIRQIISELDHLNKIWEDTASKIKNLSQTCGSEDGFKTMEEKGGVTMVKRCFDDYKQLCIRTIAEFNRYIENSEHETGNLYSTLFSSVEDMKSPALLEITVNH